MPDYVALVKYLIAPLLAQPDALRVDCETNAKGDRVWVRVAFDLAEKGRVFGRNGRTIHAIRTVLATTALSTGQIVHLEVFDPTPVENRDERPPESRDRRRRN